MSIRLRLRGPEGQATGTFEAAMTIENFVIAASTQLGCAGGEFQLLVGHPPKTVEITSEPLSSVVQSGDTVILNRAAPVAALPVPPPPAAPAAPPPPAQPASTTWACTACTLENEPHDRVCVVCGTPRPGSGGDGGGGGGGSGGGGGGAQLVKMADDNSCLFHAVSYLFSPASKPHELRSKIVSAVRADPERWNAATLGKPVEEYVAFISDSRRWGGQVLPLCAEHSSTATSTASKHSSKLTTATTAHRR